MLGNTPVGDNYRPLNSDERVGRLRAPAMAYRIQPELWFNVKGTGATDNYWGVPSGIIVQYRIEGAIYGAEYMDALNASNPDSLSLRHRNDPTHNALAIVFKWGF